MFSRRWRKRGRRESQHPGRQGREKRSELAANDPSKRRGGPWFRAWRCLGRNRAGEIADRLRASAAESNVCACTLLGVLDSGACTRDCPSREPGGRLPVAGLGGARTWGRRRCRYVRESIVKPLPCCARPAQRWKFVSPCSRPFWGTPGVGNLAAGLRSPRAIGSVTFTVVRWRKD
jgi:hypothetical protein